MPQRTVITGLGAVTPIGVGNDAFWKSLCKGKSNYSTIERFELQEWDRIRIAAQVKGFAPKDHLDSNTQQALERADARNGGLTLAYGCAAARMAVEDAGLEASLGERAGVCMGSGAGDIALIRRGDSNFTRGALSLVNALPGLVARNHGVAGMSKYVSTACATGTSALEEGHQRIQAGQYDIMIVGSADAPIDIPHFFGSPKDRRQGAKGLSTRNDMQRGMIPFDEERDGPVLGEGAGCLVLESETHARSRGARVYAQVLGAGQSVSFGKNPVQIVQEGYTCAMMRALRDANAPAVSYVNAHGTATSLNDALESAAISALFGSSVPVSSFKGTLGHTQAACASIELIGCALALQKGHIPQSNLVRPASDCADLDYVREGRELPLETILKNAAGFNGVYESVLLGRYNG